jgi:hypothetical protein
VFVLAKTFEAVCRVWEKKEKGKSEFQVRETFFCVESEHTNIVPQNGQEVLKSGVP